MASTALMVTDPSGNSARFTGWTDITVMRSLEQFASTFQIGFVQGWTPEQTAIPIREGYACAVYLDDDLVISGYVDDAEINQDASDFSMTVSGRSKAGDLCDCSAIHGKTGSWKNVGLQDIAADLLKPFGLNLVVDGTANLGEPFDAFAVQDGESVYETIERGCRARGVLLASDADGTVRFTSISNKFTNTRIIRPGNVISGTRRGSWRERFSQITLKAQSPGNATYNGKQVASQKYTVTDQKFGAVTSGVVTRYRPLVIKSEKGFGTAQKLRTRAIWERNVRAGRSQRLAYKLDGWRNAEGLWAPNVLVHVTDPVLEVGTDLLVVSATLSINSTDGSNVALELCDPRAMTVEPLTTQKAHKRGASYYITGSAPGGVDDTSGSIGDAGE